MNDHDRAAGRGIVVLVTAQKPESAQKIAASLVEERLAACVNIVPGVKSAYRWEGKVVEDEEQLLVIKTHDDRFDSLKKRIVELHTYDLPEVIALPIEDGHRPYLEWIEKETRPKRR